MYDAQTGAWVLVLNKYQRDNLLWLINMIGYGRTPNVLAIEPDRSPFHLLQTGDWAGEIAQKLGEFEPEPQDNYPNAARDENDRMLRRPNLTRDELLLAFERWMDQRFLDFMKRTCFYGERK